MADKRTPGLLDWKDPEAMERRIFLMMCALNTGAVLVSAPIFPWRITTGLMLGGFLAWLNYRWLRGSIAQAFGSLTQGTKPSVGVTRFFLRYFALAMAVVAAYWLDLVSVVATLAAMSSFAAAALFEAFIQTLFAVLHKEGN